LFLRTRGERITKAEVVEEIERIASRQGLPLTKANGRRCFGGHCFRITGAVFAYHGGATDQEVCDMGGWRSTEVMRKYLRGVPFSRTATITNRLASSAEAGPRLTTRQGAMLERPTEEGQTIPGPFLWKHALTGRLHKPGREGKTGCGGPATHFFVRIGAHVAAATDERCARLGCWPKMSKEKGKPSEDLPPKAKTKPKGQRKPMLPRKLRRMVGLK
jgi:hypothetical protein